METILWKIYMTGGLVHHYSHPSAQIDGNYTLENLYGQFDGNNVLKTIAKFQKHFPETVSNIWTKPGAGDFGSGNDVRASEAKL